MEMLITAGGFYHIGLIVFHLMFWRLFNWDTELESLSLLNRAVMQVMNISLVIIFVIFAYISFAHTRELATTPLGQTIMVLIALFWLARAFQQIIFFKLAHRASRLFFLVFFSGALLYGVPAVHSLHIIF
jgi:hypothetical protein